MARRRNFLVPRVLKSFPIYHHPAARQNYIRHARDLDALEHGIVHAHVVSLGADGLLALGIENHQVRVAADRNRPFARIQPEQFCRSGGDQFLQIGSR